MKDSQFTSAVEKEKLLKAFKAFVKSGFKESKFSKKLYQYLSCHFGFIAHYNQSGFYDVRFADPEGRLQTFSQILNAESYVVRSGDMADLNSAIQDCLRSESEDIRSVAKQELKVNLQKELLGLQQKLSTI
jgi:hypothetical protein